MPGKTSRRLNDLDAKAWVRATKSWFVINPRRRNREQLTHPAKYPEELAERFITFFTRAGQWVLDPFAGVGSTLIAAKRAGRNSVGVELVPEFADIARIALDGIESSCSAHVLVGDSRDLGNLLRSWMDPVPLFDFVMTSPPYWNMLHKSRGNNETVHKSRGEKGLPQVYSSLSEDLGNIESYDEYLNGVMAVFRQVKTLIRPGSYLVVVVQNIRDVNGVLRPVAWDLALALSRLFALRQEQIWCQDNKRLGCWGYPTTYVSNVHHHYCLVFERT
ncbi:MAG: DNA methyltransferase [Candidatus Thorarchaeota archaeon]